MQLGRNQTRGGANNNNKGEEKCNSRDGRHSVVIQPERIGGFQIDASCSHVTPICSAFTFFFFSLATTKTLYFIFHISELGK